MGNRYWTFRHRQGQGTTRDTVVFFVLNGIGLLIYYACIGLTDLAGLGKSKLWYNIALVVGTGLGTLFRFWSYRKWVWVAADASVLEAAEPPEELAQDLAAMVGAAPVTHHEGSPAPGAAECPRMVLARPECPRMVRPRCPRMVRVRTGRRPRTGPRPRTAGPDSERLAA